ncbi:MAG: hypothetical protein NTU99_14265, partial [Pseudanabaena sp. LacPavin_0818_WC45_MAG_42_6]|nr:hypothetical protein [Pseudanabaena sp. LacPavin_0818_WC45_MAG_42_6]
LFVVQSDAGKNEKRVEVRSTSTLFSFLEMAEFVFFLSFIVIIVIIIINIFQFMKINATKNKFLS